MSKNRIIAILLAILVIWWGYMTSKLPDTNVPGEPGPRLFPIVVLGLMAILTVILFFLKDEKKEEEPIIVKSEEDGVEIEVKPDEIHSMKDVILYYAVFLGVIGLIYVFGFVIGMIVGLTAMLCMIGWKLFPKAILFSLIVVLVVYGIFDRLMNIPLPAGIVF